MHTEPKFKVGDVVKIKGTSIHGVLISIFASSSYDFILLYEVETFLVKELRKIDVPSAVLELYDV